MERNQSSNSQTDKQVNQFYQIDISNVPLPTHGVPAHNIQVTIQMSHSYNAELQTQSFYLDPSDSLVLFADSNQFEQFPFNLQNSQFQFQLQYQNYDNLLDGIQQEITWILQGNGSRNDGHQQMVDGYIHFSMNSELLSNGRNPVLISIQKQSGKNTQQIQNIPIMTWSQISNNLNQGQRCSICLQQFQIGNNIRVMTCLHRYHLSCLDQWLQRKGNCPNCRRDVLLP